MKQHIRPMKNDPLFKLIVAAGIAALVLAFASPAHAADGKEISTTGTFTTSQGVSGTTSSVTTRAQGVVTRQGSWTNASGGTGTWQSQATWDKDSQTATVSGSATRPNGARTSWQATETRTAPGMVTEKGTFTRANGKQSTFTSTESRVSPGVWNKKETITTADGRTIDRTVDSSVANGKGTRTVTTTLPDGTTFTWNTSFTRTVSPLPAAAPAP
jgi:hypothetical protein